MIAIIDYKAGNLASVKKAFDHLGAEAVVTDDPQVVGRSAKLVLPGVGHFAATQELSRNGMRGAIQKSIAAGNPFLGICVGMQWMLAGSSEAPDVPGLGVIAARCQRFSSPALKVPHVGWNRITKLRDSMLLKDIDDGSFVYYAHSYFAPVTADTIATTEYSAAYSAIVENGNLFGVQFHPEKSGTVGLRLLKTFVDL